MQLVFVSSTCLIPFSAIGFNIAYLYAHFCGRYETWWSFYPAKILCVFLVGNVSVSLTIDLCERFVCRNQNSATDKGSDEHVR